jgi:hypothetical protein
MSPNDRFTYAQTSTPLPLQETIYSTSTEILLTAASDPALTEDLALSLLKRADLPSKIFDLLSKNAPLAQSRKVKLAIIRNPQCPRFISLSLVRQLFTFDLMRVALTPVVTADIKRVADEVLIGRLETISSGEKLSLARRASGAVAAALLLDSERRVIQAALDNPRLFEPQVLKALMGSKSAATLVRSVCDHPKWWLRREVRIALLRNPKTPPSRVLEIARSLPAALVREILQTSQITSTLRSTLLTDLAERSGRSGH